jgi:hypothetical protein
MSDSTWQALRAHVDHLLTRIPACAKRVEQMREELLAHLLAIYDYEFAQNPDEQRALHVTLQRFGSDSDLNEELASCVPTLERVFFSLLARKEHLMWRVFMIVGVLAAMIGMGFVCPALAQMAQQGDTGALSISLLIFGSAVTLSGVGSFVLGIQKLRARIS